MTVVFAVVFGFPGHAELAAAIVRQTGGASGDLVLHRFPDDESYVRLAGPVSGRTAVFVCGLHHPDEKLLPLIFAADAARDLGATAVGIVAPYLGYLRQDKRFRQGEAVTSATFAKILSGHADWLVTVDPHLHRFRSLDEIYSLRSTVVHAAPALSGWIRREVAEPFIIGPDRESEQWVADVAQRAGAPFTVLEKTRSGDREVEISVPRMAELDGRTPVLVDDIISTGRTMIAVLRRLRQWKVRPPVCVGVHAVFAAHADFELRASGAERVVTCNTIPHSTNSIDLTEIIAARAAEQAH